MQALMRRSDGPALIHFTAMYLAWIGASAWAVWSWNRSAWELALSQLALGLVGCSTFAALHETAHGTAFKSPALNRLAAALSGLAHVYPSTIFRELHFTHHRHTHEPGKDPEISLGSKGIPSVVSSLPLYLAWLTGVPLLSFKLGMLMNGALGMPEPLRKRLYPFVRPEVRGRLALESLFILGFHAALLSLAVFYHSGFWALFTGQVVAHCLLAVYLTPEHNGLPHEGDILERTRSMRAGTFLKALMWNMPYHAEHHAYPAVPFHALPQLHIELQEELRHRDLGYPAFHLKVLSREIT
jgi:fatty acid desaturase